MKSGLCALLVPIILFFATANPLRGGAEIEIDDEVKIDISFWTQAWAQHVNGKGKENETTDFMLRRAYLCVKGQVNPHIDFFTHIAADRIGQEGLDNPSMGLGSGAAFRDLWITFKLDEALNIQAGRMYIPLTRNYGTTSTKALLTTDLPFMQGGVRGNIFYASKVGRDDGVTLWGHLLDGLFQHRLMVSEGVENDGNPDDSLRYVGRVAINLLDPEKGWFNKGTYLGEKKVLSFGLGYDTQNDLTLNNVPNEDNRVWTADVFFDHPVGEGAVTAEAAFIDINKCTQTHNFSNLAAGDNAENWYAQAGYLLPGEIGPGRFQPYVRFETVNVNGKDDTDYKSAGINYYIKGHNAKLSLDYTNVDHEGPMSNTGIVTFQMAVGF